MEMLMRGWFFLLYVYCVYGWEALRGTSLSRIWRPLRLKMLPHRFSIQCSTTRLRTTTMGDLRSGKYPENLVFARSSDIFTIKQELITSDSLEMWEQNMDSLAAELKALNNKENILSAYAAILKVAATRELTTLQVTAFHVLANAVSDALMSLHPTNSPITSVIDDITEVHLNVIDALLGKELVSDDSGNVEESLADTQEYLCYQYAGLAQYMYNRISNSLGGSFDTTANTQEMRRNMWLAPVLSRLQRRCVRFSSSVADERIEELFAATFLKMLDKLKFEISPRYYLPSSTGTDAAKAASAIGTEKVRSLPAWELAHFVQKVLRNSVQVTDLAGLESKVCGVLRERLSARIRAVHRPMERIIEENRTFLSDKEVKTVEALLNVGHECLAAVLVLWQIRHNIVGVPNAEGVLVKDYLRPVSLHSVLDASVVKPSVAIESIPQSLRPDALEHLHSLQDRLKPSVLLQAVALLADAVRNTAGEEFRALSTYNMDSDELPFSRDAIYITALSRLLSSVLTAPIFREEILYENLLAFVVLEETLGVREPRAAASQAYEVALKSAVLVLREKHADVAEHQALKSDLQHRVGEIERATGMLLRLPEGEGVECRVRAFQSAIDEIVAEGERRGRGLRDIQGVYPWMASILQLSTTTAEAYVKPLGQTRFDKTVGEMLLNSDVAISMPELGATFEEQVHSMADALLISPQDAEDRTVILAGAVLSSFLQNALDQSRKMSAARVDSLLQKAYYMYKHPLLRRLQGKRAGQDLKEIGMQMAIARVGQSSVVDLMRVLEGARSRMAALSIGNKGGVVNYNDNTAGWGSSGASSVSTSEAAELGSFIQSIQAYLLKEFTTGNFKKGFAK